MRAIIYGPEDNGEGPYFLITEEGKLLCSHFCSSSHYAEGDLYKNRPERQPMLEAEGITEYVWIQDSGIDREEFAARQNAYAAEQVAEAEVAQGVEDAK